MDSFCSRFTSPLSFLICWLNSLPSRHRKSSPGSRMPHLVAMARAVLMLSPVTMRTVMPARWHLEIASGTWRRVRTKGLEHFHSKKKTKNLEDECRVTEKMKMILSLKHKEGPLAFNPNKKNCHKHSVGCFFRVLKDVKERVYTAAELVCKRSNSSSSRFYMRTTVVVLKPTLRFIHLGLGEVIVTTQRYTDERGADCFLCSSGGPTDMTKTQQRAHFLLTNTYKCCTVLI